jgi:hypothetical protein
MDNVSKIVDDLDIMLQNTDVVENSQMNNVYSKVCDVFKTCADKSDMLKYTNMTKRKLPCVRTNKKWFDSECKLKRKEYHNCKNNYGKSKYDTYVKKLRQASRNYKINSKKAIQRYERLFNRKLRNLRTNNPKDFWKLLCSGDKKDVTSKISLDAPSDYFKDLNIDKNEYNANEQTLAEDRSMFQNEFINKEFTVSEVRNVLNNLKCNKAAGADLLVNEFVRVTRDKLCPMFTKLFNFVLSSGVIPEAWTQGLIVPIYKKKGDVTDPNNHRGISLLSCVGKIFTSLVSGRIAKKLVWLLCRLS